MLPDESAFWADETMEYQVNKNSKFIEKYFKFLAALIILIVLLGCVRLVGTILLLSPLIAGFIVVIVIAMIALGVYQSRRMKEFRSRVELIQQRAQASTKASHIGSAVHVAGHPSLVRDQSVVLGLVHDQLNFYSYKSPSPIDTLTLSDIQAVRTVVYDNDRIPHIDVIDNTAQALQIEFTRDNQTYQCLLRRMRGKRPIDWYHAIQQARYTL